MRNIALYLSLILLFAIPCENVVSFEHFGTLSRAVGLMVALFWFHTVIVTNEMRRPHLFHVVFGLFVLWNALSLFWTIDGDRSVDRVLTYVQQFVLVLMLWDLYRTPAALRAGLQAYVLGAYVSTLSVIVNYSAGRGVSWQRYTATGFNSNDIGLILVLGMPLAWYLAVFGAESAKMRILKPVNIAYIPAALVAILLTGSRGSLVSAAPVLLFILCTLPRVRLLRSVILVAAVGWGVTFLPGLIPKRTLDRLATTRTSVAQGDLGGRGEIWREGVHIHMAHPMLGVGTAAYKAAAVQTRHVAHNVYLSILVETGIVGLTLFAVVLVITLRNALRQPKWVACFWLTVLLVWGTGALVHTWEERKQTWLFLSLVTISANLVVPRNENEPAEESLDNPLILPQTADA